MNSIIKSLKFQITSLEIQIEKDTNRLDELRIKLFKITGGNEKTKINFYCGCHNKLAEIDHIEYDGSDEYFCSITKEPLYSDYYIK